LDEQLEVSDEDRVFHQQQQKQHERKLAKMMGGVSDSESEGAKEYKRQRREKRKTQIKVWKRAVTKAEKEGKMFIVGAKKVLLARCECIHCTTRNMHRQPSRRHQRRFELADSDEDACAEEIEVERDLAADKMRSLFHKIRYSSLREKKKRNRAAHKVQSLFVKLGYLRSRQEKALEREREQERERVLAEERKRQEEAEAEAQKQARVERLLQERANRSPLFNKSVSELKASALAAGLGHHLVGMAEKAELVALLESHAAAEAAKAPCGYSAVPRAVVTYQKVTAAQCHTGRHF
jgi:hypothetical protein